VAPRELPLEDGLDALPVPATSIYSRYDGIVAWRTCLDRPSSRAENIAVVGSHLGLGHHPAVIWAVADRLAQPLGEWAPFRPARALRPLYPMADTPFERFSRSTTGLDDLQSRQRGRRYRP
jgi:hypothetical protein